LHFFCVLLVSNENSNEKKEKYMSGHNPITFDHEGIKSSFFSKLIMKLANKKMIMKRTSWYLSVSFGIFWYLLVSNHHFFSKLIMKLANEKQNSMMFMQRISILTNYSRSRLMWSLIMIFIILKVDRYEVIWVVL